MPSSKQARGSEVTTNQVIVRRRAGLLFLTRFFFPNTLHQPLSEQIFHNVRSLTSWHPI